MAFTSYIVENDEAFRRGLDRLAKTTNDFRIPFGLVAKEFYRSNKKIFSLKGPGLYQDLAPVPTGSPATSTDYKARKIREVGFAYPILVRTGRLAASLLNPADGEAIRIITKKSLTLGTSNEVAKYHQGERGARVIPTRKVVFIDGGPLEQSRGASTSGRRETWLNIVNQYIIDSIEAYENGNL